MVNKIIAVATLCVLLSGCEYPDATYRDSQKEYELAVQFCFKKENIKDFSIGSEILSHVNCTDGRSASIPPQRKSFSDKED